MSSDQQTKPAGYQSNNCSNTFRHKSWGVVSGTPLARASHVKHLTVAACARLLRVPATATVKHCGEQDSRQGQRPVRHHFWGMDVRPSHAGPLSVIVVAPRYVPSREHDLYVEE